MIRLYLTCYLTNTTVIWVSSIQLFCSRLFTYDEHLSSSHFSSFVPGTSSWNSTPVYTNCYDQSIETTADFEQNIEKFKNVNPTVASNYTIYKRHVCTYCRKVYPLKNLLRRHMQCGCKMNPRGAQFACSFCPYKSMYKANMERHVKNVHDRGSHKFTCELCNFHSNYSFCVRRHMRTFHGASTNEPK